MPGPRRSLHLQPTAATLAPAPPEATTQPSKPLSTLSTKPPLPSEVIARISDICLSFGHKRTLVNIMQASKAAYEIAGPILYRELELDEENVKYVVMGLSPKSRQYLKVKPQKPIKGADGETIKRKGYVWTAARHERKAYLFSFTESITVDTTVRYLTRVNAIVTWIACKNAQDEDSPAIPLLFPRLRRIRLISEMEVCSRPLSTPGLGAAEDEEVDVCISLKEQWGPPYYREPGFEWFIPLAVHCVKRLARIHTLSLHASSWGNVEVFHDTNVLPKQLRIHCPTLETHRWNYSGLTHEQAIQDYHKDLTGYPMTHVYDIDMLIVHKNVEIVNLGIRHRNAFPRDLDYAAMRHQTIRESMLAEGLKEVRGGEEEGLPKDDGEGGELAIRRFTVVPVPIYCTTCARWVSRSSLTSRFRFEPAHNKQQKPNLVTDTVDATMIPSDQSDALSTIISNEEMILYRYMKPREPPLTPSDGSDWSDEL